MSDEHTPGPWQIRDTVYKNSPHIVCENGFFVAETDRHNARIIAAAPVMLDALDAAAELIEYALPKFDWGKSALDGKAIQLLNEVPMIIRAAIAEARLG